MTLPAVLSPCQIRVDFLFGREPVLELTAAARRAPLRLEVSGIANQPVAPGGLHCRIGRCRIRHAGWPARGLEPGKLQSLFFHSRCLLVASIVPNRLVCTL